MNPESSYLISASQIFTLFFIMFGPLRLMIPFAEMSRGLSSPQRTNLALKSCGITLVAAVLGCVIGRSLLFNWKVEIPVLMMAAGLVFFLSGIVPMIYRRPEAASASTNGPPDPRSIAFNLMITPFGMGAAIALLAMSHSVERAFVIFLCFLGNIILDFVVMVYGHTILKHTHRIGLQILGVSLGILGIALGLEIIVRAIRML